MDASAKALKSQRKGKRGQSQWFALCRQCGIPDAESARRRDGILPGVHCEVKFRDHINVKGAMKQADEDRELGRYPVVAHRRTHERGWKITIAAMDMVSMALETVGQDSLWALVEDRAESLLVTMEGEAWLRWAYIPWAREVGLLPKGERK